VLFLAVFFVGDAATVSEDELATGQTPQGYDGGFPVPPMPAGGPVRGAAAGLTFDTGRTVTSVDTTTPAQAEPVEVGEDR
jgi:NADH-quinone oxidoreductase subunit H